MLGTWCLHKARLTRGPGGRVSSGQAMKGVGCGQTEAKTEFEIVGDISVNRIRNQIFHCKET